MRIVLTADPELPVPPKYYGGIERIVDILARGLCDAGHSVTLFANAGSVSAGRLLAWPGGSSASKTDTLRNAAALSRFVLSEGCDLIHSFSRVAYLLPVLPLNVPKLMTYQRPINPRSVRMGHALSRGTLQFTAISNAMMDQVSSIGKWHVVYNGVSLTSYDYRSAVASDASLVFLGRVEEIKGPHIAIEVAKRTGVRLVIAGNVPAEHRSWFDANVAPHVDDEQIKYVGPVDDRQKNKLLGEARALLMPILWDEPFGIVMAEAMACGTPVIGFRRGAVPEVVDDGVTGYVVSNTDEMCLAVHRVGLIEREKPRKRTEQLFSDQIMTESYAKIYRSFPI